MKQLTGARTLPVNFYSKLADHLKSRFSVGTIMEVVDKNRISQVKVSYIYYFFYVMKNRVTVLSKSLT